MKESWWKKNNNWNYLEDHIKDQQKQIEESKNKYIQLLNFSDSIDKLHSHNAEESKINEEDYEKIKVLLNSKIEENKSLIEENEKFKIEISGWKKKLMNESQQNNEYVKDLINQIKDLQEKNFEFQKNGLKLK